MTTMTDKAAGQIAHNTMKKFEDAGRSALLVSANDEGGTVYCTNDLESEDVIEIFVNVLASVSPSKKDFIKNLKLITKIVKKGGEC